LKPLAAAPTGVGDAGGVVGGVADRGGDVRHRRALAVVAKIRTSIIETFCITPERPTPLLPTRR
jgi:hypothetical protein